MALDLSGVQRSLRKLRKLLKKTQRRPSPEHVHDLRTHTRQLEATVDALGLDGRRNEHRVLSALATIRKRAGKVRDMDVLTRHAATLTGNGEQDCLVELLEYLGAERYRHARRLRTRMQDDGPPLRKRLKRTCRRVDRRVSAGDDAHPVVPKETVATALELASELAVPATLTRKSLHPYRLKVKDLRNVLKMATDSDDGLVARLGEVKDAIGEWHDWETLGAIAEEQLAHGAHCGLLHELRSIIARKYEHALALTNRMRREYLRPVRRGHAGRTVGRRRQTTPVLEATMAMAS